MNTNSYKYEKTVERLRAKYPHINNEAFYEILRAGFMLGISETQEIINKAISVCPQSVILVKNNEGTLIL